MKGEMCKHFPQLKFLVPSNTKEVSSNLAFMKEFKNKKDCYKKQIKILCKAPF